MFTDDNKTAIFEQSRKRLFGIAYRMLGVYSDAEDLVQEAYIRWHRTDERTIETPEAWLVTIVTRLSIDRLRKAKRERETYIGPWLPEPLLIADAASPAANAEFSSNLSIAFLFLLERLSPIERAVFLLHDIFDCEYAEISRITGKSETASRQIVHRARKRIRTDKPRFETDEQKRQELIRQFAAAANSGDEKTLLSLFSEDIKLITDGGGKVNAARKIIYGKTKAAHTIAILGAKFGDSFKEKFISINGEIGVLSTFSGNLFAASTFEIKDSKISAIYRVMNPEKLTDFAELFITEKLES